MGFEVRRNQELLFLIPPDVKTHNFADTFLPGRNINNMTFMISLKNKVKIVSLVGILRSIVGIALIFAAKNECPPLTSATPPLTSATTPPTTAEGAGASYAEPTFSPEENWVRIPLRRKRAVTSLTPNKECSLQVEISNWVSNLSELGSHLLLFYGAHKVNYDIALEKC